LPDPHLRGKPRDYNTGVRWAILIPPLACVPALAAQDASRPLEVRRLAELTDRRLRETSGVAVSRAHPGVIWTHNDSGDGPYLYATDSTGRVLARFEVRGALNRDWEALSQGPCPHGPWRDRTCLYIGDIGDNDERHPHAVVYALPEPDPTSGAPEKTTPTTTARSLRLRYPDRARDAEGLAVLPDGALTLITKGRSGPILRFAIQPEAWATADFDLAAPDTLPIAPQFFAGRWVTDAAVDAAHGRAVVRTYTELYFFDVGPRWTLTGPPCRIGLIEPQGEGVAFLPDGSLLLTSERARGAPAAYTIVRCP
jgi:hypothetical protein